MKRNKLAIALVLVALIILIGYFLVYIKPDHYVDGFSSIVNKSNVENNYYIYVSVSKQFFSFLFAKIVLKIRSKTLKKMKLLSYFHFQESYCKL